MPSLGFGWLGEEAQLLITTMAQSFKLEHLLERPLAQLSGGEQRLVHIAKTLINPAQKLILLDEPSVFLDFTQKFLLAQRLSERAQQGSIIIFSSHDSDFIASCATLVLAINEGQAQTMSPDQLVSFLGKRAARSRKT